MYVKSIVVSLHCKQKQIDMKTRMKLAIETYAKLTDRTFNEVVVEMQTSKLIQENIMKLMFAA